MTFNAASRRWGHVAAARYASVPTSAVGRGGVSHLAYWNLLHKILDVAAQ